MARFTFFYYIYLPYSWLAFSDDQFLEGFEVYPLYAK